MVHTFLLIQKQSIRQITLTQQTTIYSCGTQARRVWDKIHVLTKIIWMEIVPQLITSMLICEQSFKSSVMYPFEMKRKMMGTFQFKQVYIRFLALNLQDFGNVHAEFYYFLLFSVGIEYFIELCLLVPLGLK